MRFAAHEQLALPCRLEAVVPGRQHADGRRYLPQLVLRTDAELWPASSAAPPSLVVVDRHHRVDLAGVGRVGIARLVCLLGPLTLDAAAAPGFYAEPGAAAQSTTPLTVGVVERVVSWERSGAPLPFERLYAELVLRLGAATVGVRTTITADSIEAHLGSAVIAPGQLAGIRRPRIDILEFLA
jgi:hypothetical protein